MDSTPDTGQRFLWANFYSAIADKLLQYRHDRSPLVAAIADTAQRRPELPFAITDQFSDGSTGPLQDICPFTAMGVFNRSLTDANRHAIAAELAQFLGVTEPLTKLSTQDDGIPLLNNQNSWFFHYSKYRQDGDIDKLWQVFADAIAFADRDFGPSVFIGSYDTAESQPPRRLQSDDGTLLGTSLVVCAAGWKFPTVYYQPVGHSIVWNHSSIGRWLCGFVQPTGETVRRGQLPCSFLP